MPIKGRSDIIRIPRVGKIHLGIKTSNGKSEYPKAVDYFVVKPDQSTSEAAATNFFSVYGPEPKEIKICFPSDNPEEFFQQWLKAYRKVGTRYELYCKSDGETAQVADGKGGWITRPCQYHDCDLYKSGQCKELGQLQFFLPDVPGIGVWQIDTTSYYTTVNLNSSIRMLQALTGGKIKMIPITLRIIPKVVNPDGRVKTIYILELGLDDMKLTDFQSTIPLLAGTPQVEPINQDELPEDLYIEPNIIKDDEKPTSNNKEGSKNTPSIETPAPKKPSESELDDAAAVVSIQFKPYGGKNKGVALLQVAEAGSGALVEVITTEEKFIQKLEKIQSGVAIRWGSKPSEKFKDRQELSRLEIVS